MDYRHPVANLAKAFCHLVPSAVVPDADNGGVCSTLSQKLSWSNDRHTKNLLAPVARVVVIHAEHVESGGLKRSYYHFPVTTCTDDRYGLTCCHNWPTP